MSSFRWRRLHVLAAVALVALVAGTPVRAEQAIAPPQPDTLTYQKLAPDQQAFVDDLERRTFDWFWQSADPYTGLVPDSWPNHTFSSIAAIGFGLTAYGVGVERGYISRAQAVQRTLTTLRYLAAAPQNGGEDDAAGYHGFFYHFLDMRTGLRHARSVELSSVDTTLLMGGVLFAQSYYDRDTPPEKEIRRLADQLYRAVDWPWMQVRKPLISMGWTPGGKFIDADWQGYDEGKLVYLLALGSPTHPVGADAWAAWCATYPRDWGQFQGYSFLNFAPLFGHQYTETWVDFRGIRDAWGRAHDLDYAQNGRLATLAQRAYAIANPGHWTGYGAEVWGLTASDGPGDVTVSSPQGVRRFSAYMARGAGLDEINDDGTIAPTAAGGSIAFAPSVVLPALMAMKQRYGKYIYDRYGFVDAFNLSFHGTPTAGNTYPGFGWADNQQLGIDQGPILLMIENWRSGLVWKVMKKNPYIRRGLERAGFTGGWLERH